LVTRFLAGQSTRSLAIWLTEEGVPTAKGGPWLTTVVRSMLVNPRYAGLRGHRGQVIGPAVWEPIITEDEHRRVLAKMAEKKHSGRRDPQTHLLKGLLRCGRCGNKLFSSARVSRRRYVCLSGPDHRGCGSLAVSADPLERLITDAVLYRLDTAELADTLAGRASADLRTQELADAVGQAQEQLEELATAYANANEQITMREWMVAKRPISQRLERVQRQLAQLTRSDALAGLVGNGEELSRAWSSIDLSQQHAIIGAVVDHATIGPGTPVRSPSLGPEPRPGRVAALRPRRVEHARRSAFPRAPHPHLDPAGSRPGESP
jgi:hypothetical protein